MAAYILIAATTSTPEVTITADNLLSLSYNASGSIVGDEMAVDDFTAEIYANASVNIGMFVPSGSDSLTTDDGDVFYCGVDDQFLPTVPHGTQISVYADTSVLVGLYFVDTVARIAAEVWQIRGVSAFGLLEEVYHAGGLYNRTPLASVLSEIIAGRFTYSVDPALTVAGVFAASGWLPYDVARTNLHRLCLAMGISLRKNAAGEVYFTVADAETPRQLTDGEVYEGGRIEYPTPANAAEVTEFSYFPPADPQEEILFDNTDGSGAADNTLVTFEAPAYNLAATPGLTIVSYGVNFAVLTGLGVLTGVKYASSQRVTKLGGGSGRDKTASVSDNGLVNALNSYNLARRLLAYYGSRTEIQGRILQSDPLLKPGDTLTVPDAFGDSQTGIVAEIQGQVSAVTAGRYKIVSGYTPNAALAGNAFTKRAVFTANGTWTNTTGERRRIRIMLIGGGAGGQGGQNGEAGYNDLTAYSHYYSGIQTYEKYQYYASPHDKGGNGGAVGVAGTAGKVFILDLDVDPGESVTFTIGTGGTGGAAGGTYGTAGTATAMTSATMGNHSSEEGTVPQNGVSDPIDGTVYAKPGAAGTPGGAGGTTSQTESTAKKGSGFPGESAGNYAGGAGGSGSEGTYSEITLQAAGGGGGGGAYGAAGGDGGPGSCNWDSPGTATGGNGGNGANASKPAKPTAGSGGGGGNGGGGGGNAGGSYLYAGSNGTVNKGSAGTAGTGSEGGDGGDGQANVYY